MQQQGVYEVPASVELVWAALNNPAVLQRCVPGCQSMQQLDDTHFAAAVKAKVGPVNATFQVQLALPKAILPTAMFCRARSKAVPVLPRARPMCSCLRFVQTSRLCPIR